MRTILVSLYVICIPVLCVSQINKDITPIRNYSPDEYNASVQNWATVQDHRGVMYFGNSDGILEYDGKNWRLITVSNNSIVRSLAVDKNGTVFVGAIKEFGYLRPNQSGNLEYVSLSQNLDTTRYEFFDVWKTYVIDNSVWFGSFEHIFKYDYTKVSAFGNIHLKRDNRALLEYKNRLYLNNLNEGLSILEDSLRTVPDHDFFEDTHIFSMLPYDSSKVIIGTHTKGVFLFDLNKGIDTLTYRLKNNGFDFTETNLLYDGLKINDTYIYGTLLTGLIFTDKHTHIQRYINKSTGLQDNTVSSLYYNFDKKGSDKLWITTTNGVSSVDLFSSFSHLNQQHGLDSRILDMVKYKDTYYVSTLTGVYTMSFDKYLYPAFKRIESNLLPWNLKVFKVPGQKKEMLLVSTNMGPYQIVDDKYRKLPIDFLEECYQMKTSKKDSSLIYFGSKKNFTILKYDQGKWNIAKLIRTSYEIRNVIEDQSGTFWLQTLNSGIIRLNSDFTMKHFTKSGLPSLKDIRAFELNGEIIFATEKGVLKFDEQKQEFYPHELFKNLYQNFNGGFFIVQEDKNGDIWLCRYKGNDYKIERIFKNELNEYEIDSLPFKRFKFKEPEFIFPEENGDVWIGTGDGLYKYNPGIRKDYKKKFKALIRKIVLNGDSLLFNGTNFKLIDSINVIENEGELLNSHISIRKDEFKSIRFDFSAPFFEAEEKTEFSYMLEGYNDEWSKWSPETDITYTGLPAGDFIFHVKAKNVYGIESDVNSYSFTVYPPWYASVWAVIAYSLLTLWIAVRLYNRRLIRLKNKLEKIVTERTSELNQKNEILESQKKEILIQRDNLNDLSKKLEKQRDEITEELKITLGKTESLQKDNFKFQLQSLANQMNPHFIFNTLNSIQYYIYENDSVSSAKYLAKFSKLMRLILDNSQHETISIQKELEAMHLYLELESLRIEDHFEYEIIVPEDIDTGIYQIYPLLIQPYVENSVWHGLIHKKGEKKLKIEIVPDHDFFLCIIEDNGIGREKAMEIKNQKRRKHESHGTNITGKRIETINKLFNRNFIVEFTDLKDDKGNPAGTKVLLHIPKILN